MLSDQDIELLETYLDKALDGELAQRVEQRLAQEPELAAELARLQEARELRMQLWQSYEPSAESAERIIAGLRKREARRAWFWRILDYRERIAAAAACIAVFLIGWQWGRNANAYRMVPAGGTTSQPVSLITQHQVPSQHGDVYEVRLTDADGKLVRTERFDNLQDAQSFINELKGQLVRGRNR